MIFKKIQTKKRAIAYLLLACIAFQLGQAYPLAAKPAAGDPPDFDGFRPAGTEQHIDPFTGDFQYSIPVLTLPNGSYEPYKLQLSYSSSGGLDDDASWVGNGWSLTPGAIQRQVRGFPDEFKNVPFAAYQKTMPDWRTEGSVRVKVSETYSVDHDKDRNTMDTASQVSLDESLLSKISNGSQLSLGYNSSVRYGNYQGFFRTYGLSIGYKGASLGINFSPLATTYSFQPPSASLFSNALFGKDQNKHRFWRSMYASNYNKLTQGLIREVSGTTGAFSFGSPLAVTRSPRMKSNAFSLSLDLLLLIPYIHIGLEGGIAGNFSISTQNGYKTDYRANGFIYSTTTSSDRLLNDYGTEKGGSFTQRDIFLGIPFANYDHLSVSGEGMSGAFRFVPNRAGLFLPDFVKNPSTTINGGFAFNVSPTGVGIGGEFGLGLGDTKITTWGNNPERNAEYANTKLDSVKNGYFRFNYDPAGEVSYTQDPTAMVVGELNPKPVIALPGTKTCNVKPSHALNNLANDSVRRSKYISGSLDTGFVIVREDGYRYFYNYPIKSRGDVELQIGVPNSQSLGEMLVYTPMNLRKEAQAGAYSVNTEEYKALAGEVKSKPYATSFLLTKILGPDYKTVGSKEFGHYVKFAYRKRFGFAAGSGDRYYRSRHPYAGLTYSHGEVSNRRDQMAGMESSEKEIAYLQKIETSTHTAFFVNNKSKPSDYGLGGNVCASKFKQVYVKCSGIGYDTMWIPTPCNFTCDSITSGYLNTYCFDPALIECIQDSIIYSGSDGRAAFLRGSQLHRLDGLAAAKCTSTGDPMATLREAPRDSSLCVEYLEKIVVFSKFDDFSDPHLRPAQTVYFEYDYSSHPGQPNSVESIAGNAARNPGKGKLTLKRVYSEGGDQVSHRIAPYQFEYHYKLQGEFAPRIQDLYPNALMTRAEAGQEDFFYDPKLTDPWGQVDGLGRYRRGVLLSSRYQGNTDSINPARKPRWLTDNNPAKLDPAAYKLKQIRLPGGGEILINYEEKDYAQVQNKQAMTMASIVNADEETSTGAYKNQPEYTINVRDLGLQPVVGSSPLSGQAKLDSILLDEQIRLMRQAFGPRAGQDGERLYFKFLYKLSSSYTPLDPDPNDCQSEWIDGYARVDSIYQKLVPSTNERHICFKLASPGGDRPHVPRRACYDYFVTHKYKMDSQDDGLCIGIAEKFKVTVLKKDIDVSMNDHLDELVSDDPRTAAGARIKYVTPLMIYLTGNAVVPGFYNIPAKDKVGDRMAFDLSFLRVPMLKPKTGGGVRVKRVLFYEPGLEGGEAALFGKEYLYKTFVKTDRGYRIASSGVATSEPGAQRQENPLVTFIPKKSQTLLNKLAVGESLEQTEGPLGEALLPAASIGYSRIYARDVANLKHGLGYDVQEFYTCGDFPVTGTYVGQSDSVRSDFPATGIKATEYTPLDDRKAKDLFIFGVGMTFGVINFDIGFMMKKLWASQGYRFIINDFHGKARRQATYADTLSLTDFYAKPTFHTATDIEPTQPIKESVTEYFLPGEKVPTVLSATDDSVRYAVPGREADLAMEMRSVRENQLDLRFSFDLNFWAPLFNPTFSAALGFNLSDQQLNTHAVSHVIRYPAIVKSTTTYQNQVSSRQEQLVFDRTTGQPLLTRSKDSYNGYYYDLGVPAYWFAGTGTMGPRALAATNHNQLTDNAITVRTYNANPAADRVLLDTLKNVVSAQAQTFREYAESVGSTSTKFNHMALDAGVNPATSGANKLGCFRAGASYVVKAGIESPYADQLHTAGLIQSFPANAISGYPNNLHASPWLRSDSVALHNLAARPVENVDALGFSKSSGQVPVGQIENLTATLAEFGQGAFVDFEAGSRYGRTADFGSGSTRNTNVAHTGGQSLKMTASATMDFNDSLYVMGKGATDYYIQVWAKANDGGAVSNLEVQLDSAGTVSSVVLAEAAQCEGWRLMRGTLSRAATGLTRAQVSIKNNGSSIVFLDDFRIQPDKAEMKCVVYDYRKLKVLAVMDENHFATLYQYDNKDRLIRKMKETVEGRVTTQETIATQPEILRWLE